MSPEILHQLRLLSCVYLSLGLVVVVLWRLRKLQVPAFAPSPESSGTLRLPERQSQLRQHARWLVQLRWTAIFVLLILVLIGVPIAELLPYSSLPWLLGWCLVLVLSNLVSGWLIGRQVGAERLLFIQIVIDLVVLTGLLNASGGIENPLYLSYLFPVIVAAILLSHRAALVVAVIACLLFGVLVAGEALGVLPHVTFGLFPHAEVVSGSELSSGHHPATVASHASYDSSFVAGRSLALLALLLVASYLTSLLRERLRDSEEVISKVAHRAILEQERLEGMLHAAGVGMMVVGPDQVVEWFSRSVGRWLGWQVEVRGKVCPLFQARDGCQDCVADLVFRHGKPEEAVRRVVDEDGGVRYVRHAAEAVRDDAGRVVQVVELVEDITRRRAIEAETVHAAKLSLLGRFAAGLAHEIGNPLASLTTRLKRLERQRDPVFLDESLALLREHLGRIGRTVRNVSLFSRNQPAEWEPCGVDGIVEAAVSLIRLDRKARGVSFERVPSGTLIKVRGVRDQLVQVLVNLLLNAVEATSSSGTISIGTSVVGEHVELTVSDTGAGLAPEVRRRLFEPFFTTKKQGVGLGLALSKSLVEAHGGDIHVDSKPGEGTCFTVTLPLVKVGDVSRERGRSWR